MKIEHRKIDKSSWDEVTFDGWFKTLVPPSWELDEEGDVLIYDPEGFGELTIAFLKKETVKEKKKVAHQIISNWEEQLGQKAHEIDFFKRTKDLLIMSAEFIAQEEEGEISFWRIFAVVGAEIALDISYSCDIEDKDREGSIIEGIIDSIQLEEPRFRLLLKM